MLSAFVAVRQRGEVTGRGKRSGRSLLLLGPAIFSGRQTLDVVVRQRVTPETITYLFVARDSTTQNGVATVRKFAPVRLAANWAWFFARTWVPLAFARWLLVRVFAIIIHSRLSTSEKNKTDSRRWMVGPIAAVFLCAGGRKTKPRRSLTRWHRLPRPSENSGNAFGRRRVRRDHHATATGARRR